MGVYVIEERLRKLLHGYPVGAVRMLREFYYEKLYIIAHNLVQNAEAAEYLSENTLLLVHDNHKKLAEYGGITIRHYMVRTVRNNAIVCYRWQGYDDLLSRDIVMKVTMTERQ